MNETDAQPPVEPTTVVEELNAMDRIVAAMTSIDSAAQGRVLRWLVDRYGDTA